MYKVFFNESVIQLSSDSKKSFKNNILNANEQERYDSVNQLVFDLKKGDEISNLLILDQQIDLIWNYFRRQFVEIPAAGGLVQNSVGDLLFIKRMGVWDLPKGKIEKKETPEVAAIREVEEECGLSGLKLVRPLDSTLHIYRSPFLPEEKNLVLKEIKWFLMSYSGNEIPVPQTEEDIEDVRWIPVTDMNRMLENTYRSLREFLNKTLPLI